MKLLIISDTHNSITLAGNIIERVSDKVCAVLHLGDMYTDAVQLERRYPFLAFHYVAGNCDYYYSTDTSMSDEKILEYSGAKIFMTHGHKYNIKRDFMPLAEGAKKKGASVALCGHSHVPYNNVVNGILIVNPGSLTYPRRPQKRPSYAVLDISDEGMVNAGIVSI